MERYALPLEIASALILGGLLVFLSLSTSSHQVAAPVATTTAVQVAAPPKKITAATTSTSIAKPIATIPALDVTAGLRSSLVNIICYAPPSGEIKSISGSGIMVGSQGMILTNAHIGQYFLLSDRGISCTIRTGAPAADAYKASLAFISPAWVEANDDVLTQTSPIGTGEHDFAVLVVTGSATAKPIPNAFSFISFATSSPTIGTSVTIASYGGQSLAYDQIRSALFPTIIPGTVKELFTFATDSIDVISLGGSSAAQEGSSGGGVIDATGNLIATLTTSTIEGDTNTRSLHAITTSYIRREYEREAGQSFDSLLSQAPAAALATFAPRIPKLEKLITSHLR